MKARRPQGQLRRTLLAIMEREGRGLDAEELYRLSEDMDRKRISDTLYDMHTCGLVEVFGESRNKTRNGKPLKVYRITATGREAMNGGLVRKKRVAGAAPAVEKPRYSMAIFEAWPRSVTR